MMSSASLAQVETTLLSAETHLRLERVPEFKFIQEEADKLGVKVYLFGGTASAFAHYVRWDLEREAGDEKYQAERFDYDFTNIYRGNQDLDIVVDGTAEQASTLQEILKKEYPHFVGSKEAWEVRLLRTQVGDKLPLLDNPDFLNQHTDTNSTGMIAVNADPGEIIFRDLFDWENPDSIFLNDVAAGRIKFLFSDSHKTTSRFKNGQNPPVFAAIRYLAKLAQYEVDEAEGDLEIIKRIVKETNWSKIKNNSYVKHKLEEFGKKVLLNAPDSEYAWNLLEETGLRKRLIEMDGNRISSVESLSWWMSKEPLRTKPLGEGNGKTAAEIFRDHANEDGEIVVAHETNSFEAYENITRSSHGAANAFISRDSVNGEAAAYGNGFYTRLGEKGARGTNLTIRFILNPEAREGTDFIYDDDFIILKNKSAIMLIQEDLNISITDFLILIDQNSKVLENKGLLEKIERRLMRIDTGSKEFDDAIDFVKQSYFIDDEFASRFPVRIFNEYSKLDFEVLKKLYIQGRYTYLQRVLSSLSDEELFDNHYWIEQMYIKGDKHVRERIAKRVLSDKRWVVDSDLIWSLIGSGSDATELVKAILLTDEWMHSPEVIEFLIKTGDYDELIFSMLKTELWANHPSDWRKQLILQGNIDENLSGSLRRGEGIVLNLSREEVSSILRRGYIAEELFQYVFTKDKWMTEEGFELLRNHIGKEEYEPYFAAYLLVHKEWRELWPTPYMNLINRVFKRSIGSVYLSIMLEKTDMKEAYEIALMLIKQGHGTEVAKYIFKNESFKDHEKILNVLMDRGTLFGIKDKMGMASKERGSIDRALAIYVFSQEEWSNRPELLSRVIQRGQSGKAIAQYVLSQPHWVKFPHLLEELIDKNSYETDFELIEHVFTKSYWQDSMHLVVKMLQKPHNRDGYIFNQKVLDHILSEGRFIQYPEILDAVVDNVLINQDSNVYSSITKDFTLFQGYEHFCKELVRNIIDTDYYDGSKKVLETLIKNCPVHKELIEGYFSKPESVKNKSLFKDFLFSLKTVYKPDLIPVLSSKHWKEYPEIYSFLLIDYFDYKFDEDLAAALISDFEKKETYKILESLIKRGRVTFKLMKLGALHIWKDKPELIFLLIESSIELIQKKSVYKSSNGESYTRAELIKFVNQQLVGDVRVNTMVNKDRWYHHPDAVAYLNDASALKLDSLFERIKEISFQDWRAQRVYSCRNVLLGL